MNVLAISEANGGPGCLVSWFLKVSCFHKCLWSRKKQQHLLKPRKT